MKRKFIILGSLAALVLAYLVAAPWITVYQIKAAAQAHDDVALAEHVDFPSVRASLKDQLNARFMRKMTDGGQLQDNPLAALVAPLAGAMVDKMVDWYVTPAGVIELLDGQPPREDAGRGASRDGARAEHDQPLAGASMSYTSPGTFVVQTRAGAGVSQFVLRRRGLGWKLTAIVLR